MLTQRSRSVVAFGAVLAVLAACQDAPTGIKPEQITRAGVTQLGRPGLHTGQVPFYCTLGRHAPSSSTGWQTRPDTLFFPHGELDEAGRTIRYEYQRSFPDGRPLTAASCVVPYTEGALRRVDRFFGVKKGGGVDQFRARQGTVTIQGCVSDGLCALDPLVVVAPPPEPADYPPCTGCDAPFPGTSPGGGGGSTEGTDGSPSGEDPTPEEEADARTCPKILSGKVITAAIVVAGRIHEFKFDGPMTRTSTTSTPATYAISHSTVSEDSWWIAESGTINVNCNGYFTPSALGVRFWVGTASYAGRSDLHMVMGPGHPTF